MEEHIMRGLKWILVLLFLIVSVGQAAEMSVQFGALPLFGNSTGTIGASVLFPGVLTSFLTPELTAAYWTVHPPSVVYASPLPGEYEPRYFYWGYHNHYDGPWDAIATGVRLNLENAWPLFPRFFACGAGIEQLAAWHSENTVHHTTFGVLCASGFVRIQVPTATHLMILLEIDGHGKLLGEDDFPGGFAAAKMGFRFGI
jgi:hypothetical protein